MDRTKERDKIKLKIEEKNVLCVCVFGVSLFLHHSSSSSSSLVAIKLNSVPGRCLLALAGRVGDQKILFLVCSLAVAVSLASRLLIFIFLFSSYFPIVNGGRGL